MQDILTLNNKLTFNKKETISICSKQQLIDLGVVDMFLKKNVWYISIKDKTSDKIRTFKSVKSTTHHKYGKDMTYYIFSKSPYKEECKGLSCSVARVAYVWNVADISNIDVITHKDRNKLNNKLENLQCVTKKEALLLKKRQHNQWTYIHHISDSKKTFECHKVKFDDENIISKYNVLINKQIKYIIECHSSKEWKHLSKKEWMYYSVKDKIKHICKTKTQCLYELKKKERIK